MSLRRTSFILCAWIVMLPGLQNVAATTYQVDCTNGSDSADGITPATAWRTIQRAANMVRPGDEVVVAPGVYLEHVVINRVGQAGAPIIFRSSGGAANTVVSGANAPIRNKTQTWTLEDAALLLYSTPFTYEPATVVADNVDLFAYQTLAELRTFWLASANNSSIPAPGPQQGFAFDSGRLWVRLNPTGKYGSTNPANHVMKASGPRAGGFRGDVIQQPSDYNWSVQTTTPAHVVIDGFTCESPGYAGIWIQYGNVTVRNCVFLGCRTGVRGWENSEEQPTLITSDVVVQQCEYSQYPAFDDMLDVVAIGESLDAAGQAALPPFFWWSRKGGTRTSEIGLVTSAGLRWRLLNNDIHDTLDGLSFMAIGWSNQIEIAGNFFHRLVDNAIEVENHANNVRAHDNYMLDVYEPFSYQPLGGAPFPASIWFYRNIVSQTSATAEFWRKPILNWVTGCLKIKPSSTFTGVGLDGFLFFNNTIHFPGGNLFTLNSRASAGTNFKFYNNLAITRDLQTGLFGTLFPYYDFSHNIAAPSEPGLPGPGAQFAGSGGQVIGSTNSLGLENLAAARFAPTPGSALVGAGVAVDSMPGSSVDVGALALNPLPKTFAEWRFRYFYDVITNSAVSSATADADHDGIANAMECLLASQPLQPDPAPLPAVSLDATGHLQMQFTRMDPLPVDLTWLTEVSSDLINWSTGAGVVEILPSVPVAPGRVLETVRDLAVPAAAGRYARLRVALAETAIDTDPPDAPQGVVDDRFTDGGRGNGGDVLDTDWYYLAPPNSGTPPILSVVDDGQGIASANALEIDNTSTPGQTSSKSVVAVFPLKSLELDGDHLDLKFDFRLTRIAVDRVENFLRFGFYRSNGSKVSRDGDFKPGHAGYLASVKFGATAAPCLLLKESGEDGNFNHGSDLTTLGQATPGEVAVDVSAQKYSASLRITKTGTASQIVWKLFDALGATLASGTVSDAAGLQSFDELLISSGGSELDYRVDNVFIDWQPAAP